MVFFFYLSLCIVPQRRTFDAPQQRIRCGQNTRTRLPRSPPSSSAAGFVPSALAARRGGEGPRLTGKGSSRLSITPLAFDRRRRTSLFGCAECPHEEYRTEKERALDYLRNGKSPVDR